MLRYRSLEMLHRPLAHSSHSQGTYDFWLTGHAKDQMEERELIVGDVHFLLRNGYVFDTPVAATRPDFFEYLMRSRPLTLEHAM